MTIRTYYWYDRIKSEWEINLRNFVKPSNGVRFFKTGNAGDILTKDILSWHYKKEVINIENQGRRLLLIGSISHKIQATDIICGIGTKGEQNITHLANEAKVYGLRGPLSYDEFKKNGFDLSNVKFLMDPGLLVRFMFQHINVKPITGKISFIPHYRERHLYKNRLKGIDIIDIDDFPESIAVQILQSEYVFSSSLHGIIFCHALNRPVSFVAPKTPEPLLKFKDYYASINLNFPTPIDDLRAHQLSGLKLSTESINYQLSDFYFPPISELMQSQVAI